MRHLATRLLVLPVVVSLVVCSTAEADPIVYDNQAGPTSSSGFASVGELVQYTPLTNFNFVQVAIGLAFPNAGLFDLSIVAQFYDTFVPVPEIPCSLICCSSLSFNRTSSRSLLRHRIQQESFISRLATHPALSTPAESECERVTNT